MLIVRLQGGLGNQMFQYALGRTLEHRFAQALKFDLEFFARQRKRIFLLDGLNLDCARIEDADRPMFRHAGRIPFFIGARWLLGRTGLRIMPRYVAEGDCLEDLSQGDYYLDGYWQREEFFLPVAGRLRREFTLRGGIPASCTALADEMTKAGSVAVHVRRGDYVADARTAMVHGACDVAYYRASARIMSERLQSPRYFVFSDDREWARENLDFLRGAVFVAPEPRDDRLDLVLMRLCRHFIIANSSFSWWGAWLGDSPDKTVIAPARWFALPGKDEHGIVPRGWLRVGC